jgi:hypothetical protein
MKKVVAICCLVSCVSQLSFADAFKIVGSRALGMGGAGVAVVGDSQGNSNAVTQYWNPAALGLHDGVSIDIPVGVQIEATGGILNSAKQISDSAQQFTDIQNAQKSTNANGTAINIQDINAFCLGLNNLQKLNSSGLGVLLGVNGGLNSAFGSWGISANYFASVGIIPHVDLTHLNLGGTSSSSSVLRRALQSSSDNSGLGGINLANFQTLLGNQNITPADIQTLTTAPGQTPSVTGSNLTVAGSDLSTASTQLATTIQTLATQAGVSLTYNGTTYTAQQIANAVVNAASNPTAKGGLGLSDADIASTVNTIVTNTPLLQSLLQNAQNGNSNNSNSQGFSDNTSNVTLKGIAYDEIGIGHGVNAAFIDDSLKHLYMGMNVKYIQGTVGYDSQEVFSQNSDAGNTNNVLTDLNKNIATSSAFGVDLGMLYDLKDSWKTRVGVLWRNLNNPTFTQPQAAKDAGVTGNYELGSQARAGIAFWPFKPMTIAVDYDLTQNDTPVDGYNSRYVGGGIEYNIFNKKYVNLALRGGVMKNLANSSASMAYTGGFALNLFHLVIDVTGAMSSETVEIDNGQSIPSSGAVNFTLGLTF